MQQVALPPLDPRRPEGGRLVRVPGYDQIPPGTLAQTRLDARLLQLGLFSLVKPVIEEVDGENYVNVHYYLVPTK